MLIDSYPGEDVLACVPEGAVQTDPVLRTQDSLLEDDQLYQAVRADLEKRYKQNLKRRVHWEIAPIGQTLPTSLSRYTTARRLAQDDVSQQSHETGKNHRSSRTV